MNKVAVIVVTFNRINLLQECITSIRNQTYKDFSIVVVNNGSTDGTKEWLEKQNDIITINQANSGGAGGFYSGLKYSCEKDFTYSWIMDDDTIPTETALAELMKNIELTKGFLCSKVIDLDNLSCNVPAIDYSITSNGEFSWGEFGERGLIKVTMATFVSVLLHNSTVLSLGLPFKEYFIWGDDSEYTRRISRQYPSYLCLNSLVIHKRVMGGTISILKETNPKRIKNFFYAYRNRITNARKESTKSFFVELMKVSGLCSILMLKGQIKKSYIVGKAILASMIFSPKVDYPE